MLYKIYETQRSFMEPFADFALAASKFYSNPLSPLQKRLHSPSALLRPTI
jgi:poly(3-hydroxybutyrate) depolymerase